MSELLNSLLDATKPQLETTIQGLADDYLGGFQDMVEGANAHVRPAVLGHLKKAAQYKWKAINSDDETTRRQYVEGVQDELASAKTVLKSEGVAISEEQAATFAAGFSKVLDAVGSVAKGLVTTLGSALVSGAIKGITGGGGGSLDLSGIFPGA